MVETHKTLIVVISLFYLYINSLYISKPTLLGNRVPRILCHVWTCTDNTEGGYIVQNLIDYTKNVDRLHDRV